MEKREYEEIAHSFVEAMKKLVNNQDNLDNFEYYISMHFAHWLKNYATTPEDITSEISAFANM